MRKFDVLLPRDLNDDICYISSEIERLKIAFEESSDENSMEKRPLILLIATFTEQSLKLLRTNIIGTDVPVHIQKYFNKKNETEPLYVKISSGKSIFDSFDIQIDNLTADRLRNKKGILFFEKHADLEDFETIINKNRNIAAHEPQPHFTMNFQAIKKFFDYSLLFLEHYYSELESQLSNSIETDVYTSIDSYEEYFIQKFDLDEVIYRKRKYEMKFKEEFSVSEWECVFNTYLRMKDSDKTDNSFLTADAPESEFTNKANKIIEPRNEWQDDGGGFQMRKEICADLATLAIENKKYIKYPIKICKNKIYFGCQ